MSSPFWAANLLGMVTLFAPAFWLFLRTIAPVEEQLQERKLYLACGGGASFQALVARRSKAFVIVTFLAVLDLAQRQAISLVFGLDPQDFAVEPVPGVDSVDDLALLDEDPPISAAA